MDSPPCEGCDLGLHENDEGPDTASGEPAPPPVPAWLDPYRGEVVPLVPGVPESRIVNFLKYCLHGLLYSIVLTVVGIPWAFAGFLLVVCGGILGLAVVIVVGLALMGWANSVVTGWLWFEVERGVWVYILHGLLLGIALGLVDLVPLLVVLVLPSLLTALVVGLLFLPVFGLVAMGVAAIWQVPPESPDPLYDASAEGP